ncbi:hypothetical protein O181_040441 [Austropuccinia psidii MF-1]|uniref:Integrase catalytic domain-containing protein n=1 Tax=Austropuccinia psidii MF-1 TaxID=1389203 RepID=A0A9Q3HDE0_9BASI|nr:hypothetical protein [Austropuccinia psidii MF-1]
MDIGTDLLNQIKESYKMDRNCHILCQLLMKDFKDPSLFSKLDEIWNKAYDQLRFYLLFGILYHRGKHTCVIKLKDRTLRNIILNESHDIVLSGHLLQDETLEKVKTFSWSQNWRKDVAEYFQTCDRCQKSNRAIGKKFGMMIQIKEPKSPGKIVYMDWVTALPPGRDRSFNAFLVLVDRFSQTPIFLPCCKDDTALDKAIMIWGRSINHRGLFQNFASDRDPKFTSALWKNLHKVFPEKLSFSTS